MTWSTKRRRDVKSNRPPKAEPPNTRHCPPNDAPIACGSREVSMAAIGQSQAPLRSCRLRTCRAWRDPGREVRAAAARGSTSCAAITCRANSLNNRTASRPSAPRSSRPRPPQAQPPAATCAELSGVATNREPNWTASAPSIMAASRPSCSPPAAMTGTSHASATAGTKHIVVVSRRCDPPLQNPPPPPHPHPPPAPSTQPTLTDE